MALNASSATALSGLLEDILAEQTLSDVRGRFLHYCVLFCGDGKIPCLSLASHQAGREVSANSA